MPGTTEMTVREAGRKGGQARTRKLSPERRREIAQDAFLTTAVRTIVRRWDDLTDEERAAISQAMAGGPR